MTEPLTLTGEEAARIIGVGRATAYQAVRAGQIPSVRVGRRVLVPRHALFALLGATEGIGTAETPPDDDEAPRLAA